MTYSRRRRRRLPRRSSGPGPGVDARGAAVVDPTQNVLDLVQAAIERQDDLRNQEARHIREMAEVRERHAAALRAAETARIDAIRLVDVGAVQRAAENSAQQVSLLASQVAQSAEAARSQVAATATAASTALTAALEPIQKAVADLRRAQYEAQGIRSNVTESRLNYGAVLGGIAVLVALVGLIVSLTR